MIPFNATSTKIQRLCRKWQADTKIHIEIQKARHLDEKDIKIYSLGYKELL